RLVCSFSWRGSMVATPLERVVACACTINSRIRAGCPIARQPFLARHCSAFPERAPRDCFSYRPRHPPPVPAPSGVRRSKPSVLVPAECLRSAVTELILGGDRVVEIKRQGT